MELRSAPADELELGDDVARHGGSVCAGVHQELIGTSAGQSHRHGHAIVGAVAELHVLGLGGLVDLGRLGNRVQAGGHRLRCRRSAAGQSRSEHQI